MLELLDVGGAHKDATVQDLARGAAAHHAVAVGVEAQVFQGIRDLVNHTTRTRARLEVAHALLDVAVQRIPVAAAERRRIAKAAREAAHNTEQALAKLQMTNQAQSAVSQRKRDT